MMRATKKQYERHKRYRIRGGAAYRVRHSGRFYRPVRRLLAMSDYIIVNGKRYIIKGR